MIYRLLLSKQNYKQLVPVLFGCFFGLLMLLVSLQVYQELNQLITTKKDLLGDQYLVINKPVRLINSLQGDRSGFSEAEIQELLNLKAVEQVGRFTSNRFQVKAGFEFSDQQMLTDMFFESVSDSFLDIKPDEWLWEQGQTIPIILPTDYINLYNFGFAPVQNLPQISKSTAQMAGLSIRVSDGRVSEKFEGRIAGFTDRINSVLVPETFMHYANSKFAVSETALPSRLIIRASDISAGELNTHLQANGYEANQEQTKTGRLQVVLNLVLKVLLLIGAVIIMLALIGFIQYAQLLVNRSESEIRMLLLIGFQPLFLFKKYWSFFSILIAIVGCLSWFGLILSNHYFTAYAEWFGFRLSQEIHYTVTLVLPLLLLSFVLINAIQIYRTIYRLANPA